MSGRCKFESQGEEGVVIKGTGRDRVCSGDVVEWGGRRTEGGRTGKSR